MHTDYFHEMEKGSVASELSLALDQQLILEETQKLSAVESDCPVELSFVGESRTWTSDDFKGTMFAQQ